MNPLLSDAVVEAVARNICLNLDADPDWGNPPLHTYKANEARAHLSAALKALTAAGYVVVPMEPTEAMVEKGDGEMPLEVKHWFQNGVHHAEFLPPEERVSSSSVYKAMLAAAEGA